MKKIKTILKMIYVTKKSLKDGLYFETLLHVAKLTPKQKTTKRSLNTTLRRLSSGDF